MGLQLLDNAGGLVRVHIGEDQGHGLGAFVLQGGEQGFDVRLVEEGELPILQGLGHLLQKGLSGLVAEGLLQHGAGIFQAALGNRLAGHAVLIELGEHRLGLLGVEHSQPGHLQGEHLDLLRLHELVQAGGLIGSQRDDHCGSLLLGCQL